MNITTKNTQPLTNEERISLVETIRGKLAEAELTEAELLAWLRSRNAIKTGVSTLYNVPLSHVTIILANWDSVRVSMIEEAIIDD
jgi:hypothetical protein